MEQGMEERRLSIYLGNRNALEILKLRGLYRTRISPLPLPLPSLIAYSFTRVIDLRLVLLPRRSTVHFYTVDASLTKFPAT